MSVINMVENIKKIHPSTIIFYEIGTFYYICRKKLPQFTTMNVIDGQAGLVNYSSLIFYSLTIDNILNIIVLLILAGVTIATLTGENGILTRATESKEETQEGKDIENIKLAISESNIPQGEQGEKSEEAILKEIIEKNTGKDVGISKKEENGSYIVTIGDKEYVVDGSSVTSKEPGITDKQIVLVASTDNIIFTNTISEEDVKAEYPNYQSYQVLGISKSEAGEYKTSGEIEGKAGNLEIIGDLQQSTFQYKLNKPMLGDEEFFVKVSINGEERIQKLEVIQGDIVRYEEDKLTFINSDNATEDKGVWIEVENENFSNGKAKRVECTKESNNAKFDFDFKGTTVVIIGAQNKSEQGTLRNVIYKKEDMSRVASVVVQYEGLADEDSYNDRFCEKELPDGNIEYYQENTVVYISALDYFKTGESSMYIDAVDIYR